jgi:hypothetical protein
METEEVWSWQRTLRPLRRTIWTYKERRPEASISGLSVRTGETPRAVAGSGLFGLEIGTRVRPAKSIFGSEDN